LAFAVFKAYVAFEAYAAFEAFKQYYARPLSCGRYRTDIEIKQTAVSKIVKVTLEQINSRRGVTFKKNFKLWVVFKPLLHPTVLVFDH
jgi:hypothetical protein